MKKIKILIIGLILILLSGPFALSHATTIFSEDFNNATGTNPWNDFSEKWSSTVYFLGSSISGLPNWTFNGQSLVAQNGVNLADKAILLNENPPGSMATLISAPITITPGTSYLLTFDHWGDNRPGSPGYIFTVSINGSLLSTISRIYPQGGPGVTESLLFTPLTNSINLSFLMTTSAEASPIIDNINISTVPEPTTMLLLGFGLFGLAGISRKFKK